MAICIYNIINFDVFGFDWDVANIEKCCKHGVSIAQIESVFHHNPLIAPDIKHSKTEKRFIAIGLSQKRPMFVAFTLRNKDNYQIIRPISARFMHEKEVKAYEKNT